MIESEIRHLGLRASPRLADRLAELRRDRLGELVAGSGSLRDITNVSDGPIVLVRRLVVRARVGPGGGSDGVALARRIGDGCARSLEAVRRTGGDDVMEFPSLADYLSFAARELLAGGNGRAWYFGPIRGQLAADLQATIVNLAAAEPQAWAEATALLRAEGYGTDLDRATGAGESSRRAADEARPLFSMLAESVRRSLGDGRPAGASPIDGAVRTRLSAYLEARPLTAIGWRDPRQLGAAVADMLSWMLDTERLELDAIERRRLAKELARQGWFDPRPAARLLGEATVSDPVPPPAEPPPPNRSRQGGPWSDEGGSSSDDTPRPAPAWRGDDVANLPDADAHLIATARDGPVRSAIQPRSWEEGVAILVAALVERFSASLLRRRSDDDASSMTSATPIPITEVALGRLLRALGVARLPFRRDVAPGPAPPQRPKTIGRSGQRLGVGDDRPGSAPSSTTEPARDRAIALPGELASPGAWPPDPGRRETPAGGPSGRDAVPADQGGERRPVAPGPSGGPGAGPTPHPESSPDRASAGPAGPPSSADRRPEHTSGSGPGRADGAPDGETAVPVSSPAPVSEPPSVDRSEPDHGAREPTLDADPADPGAVPSGQPPDQARQSPGETSPTVSPAPPEYPPIASGESQPSGIDPDEIMAALHDAVRELAASGVPPSRAAIRRWLTARMPAPTVARDPGRVGGDPPGAAPAASPDAFRQLYELLEPDEREELEELLEEGLAVATGGLLGTDSIGVLLFVRPLVDLGITTAAAAAGLSEADVPLLVRRMARRLSASGDDRLATAFAWGPAPPSPLPPADTPVAASASTLRAFDEHLRARAQLHRIELTPATARSAEVDEIAELLAELVCRRFVSWLRGLESSSTAYVLERFAHRPGSYRIDGDRVVASWPASGFDALLEIAGYLDHLDRVPWWAHGSLWWER